MNNNTKAYDLVNTTNGQFSQLVWIGAAPESNQLRDMISEINAKDWQHMFPAIPHEDVLNRIRAHERPNFILVDNQYLGLLAEVLIRECDDFEFDESGTPLTWEVHQGIYTSRYIYAENREALLAEFERVCKEEFDREVEIAKKQALQKTAE